MLATPQLAKSYLVSPDPLYQTTDLPTPPTQTHSGISLCYTVSVLGREERYTVKYNPPPEGVPEGKAQENS